MSEECHKKPPAITTGDSFSKALQYHQAGQYNKAEKLYRHILKTEPTHSGALNYLGALAHQAGQDEIAVTYIKRALSVSPDYAEAYNNLGISLKCLGRFDDAIAAFRKAISLDPDNAVAHISLHYTLLLLGQFEKAWPEVEWHWKGESHPHSDRGFPQPVWDGASLKDRTLLVWGEFGVGDEIMYAGLLTELAAVCKQCIIECDPRLVELFCRSFQNVHVVARRDPPHRDLLSRDIDFQCSIGRLPRWLRPTGNSFKEHRGFLHASQTEVTELRTRYQDDNKRFIVGISWQGGADNLRRSSRSIPIASWKPILSCKDIQFVSLQYGDVDEELRAFSLDTGISVSNDDTVDPLENIDRFASQVAACNLVISIDNTTVHMAGALGVKAWVLLPVLPDWRWMLERDDSPWYPSVRLFRQTVAGEWDVTIDTVATSLRDLVTARQNEKR